MTIAQAFRHRRLVVGLGGVVCLAGLFAAATPSSAQIPLPSQLVRHIDLKCYGIYEYIPGFPFDLTLTHLNPVLRSLQLAPEQMVRLGRAEQLCVPVFKNGSPPPPHVRRFVEFMDFVCHTITTPTPPPPLFLRLDHLNPIVVQSGAPPETVSLTTPKLLCLPVEKIVPEGPAMPPDVRRLVEWIDLKCYAILPVGGPQPLNLNLKLHHLNPLLASQPIEYVQVTDPEQLCVPVLKSRTAPTLPPKDILNVIQWIDIKKYRIEPLTTIPVPGPLTIRHINPLVAGVTHTVTLIQPEHLGLPVAKNGQFPRPEPHAGAVLRGRAPLSRSSTLESRVARLHEVQERGAGSRANAVQLRAGAARPRSTEHCAARPRARFRHR